MPHAFGHSLNGLLAYTTIKQVRIHDWRLGCLYYTFIFLIISWVIGFQIFYGNNHYRMRDVRGTVRMTIQQPTKGCNPNDNDCEDNFKPANELPYCKEYTGLNGAKYKQPCKYFDQHELLPEGMLEDKMFVPTRVDLMRERRACEPSEANGWHCKKLWELERYDENTYVADIEDFTVLMVSAYYRGDLRGSSTEQQGFYYECRDNKTGKIIGTLNCKTEELVVKRIPCVKPGICGYDGVSEPPRVANFLQQREYEAAVANASMARGVRRRDSKRSALALETEAADSVSDGDRIGEDTVNKEESPVSDGIFAIPQGDIFRFSKLLELAGLDLDDTTKHPKPMREEGTVIGVRVEFANLHHWTGQTEPGYIYRVTERPMEEMKTEVYSRVQPPSSYDRLLENRHGIYLVGSVEGSFGTWDIVYLLVMLTTALGMLGVATSIVDFLALYVPMPGMEGIGLKEEKIHEILSPEEQADLAKMEMEDAQT